MKRNEFPFVLRDYAYEKIGLEDIDSIRGALTNENRQVDKEEHTKYVEIAKDETNIEDRDVQRYDKNIKQYTDKISVDSLRYYQYVSILLTEFVLDEMSSDKESFYSEMKEMCIQEYESVLPYLGEHRDDLNKLAFSMATGSGKTIILQINILQYRNYFDENTYQNIILVTPNERITEQHVKNINIEGLDVKEYYGTEVTEKDTVYVAHIQRLNQSLGIGKKRNVLGNDNLVFIDEGHRGLSSKDGSWLETREELYNRGGFCFEYSATLVNPINGNDRETIGKYARSIIYDYSFGEFKDDDYGKEPRIVNLNQEGIPRAERKWIILNTIKHYEKLLRYNTNRDEAHDYNISRPLMLLAGSTIDDDLVKYVKCILDVINEEEWVMDFFDDLLNKDKQDVDELVKYIDSLNVDFNFDYLSEIYSNSDVLVESVKTHLFNSKSISELEVTRHMNGSGEVTLSDPQSKDDFALITVGDDNARRIQEKLSELKSVTTNESMTSERQFSNIDSKSSSKNILIGTTKFARGWDSNRPSSIGFLNIGSTEGPTVVQMFGRGVRLQGKNNDGKRYMGSNSPMEELQKLDVFGVKADYIDTFKDTLDDYDQGVTSADKKTKTVELDTQKDRQLSKISLPIEESIGKVKPKRVSALIDEVTNDSTQFTPATVKRTYEIEELEGSIKQGSDVILLSQLKYNGTNVSIDIFDWNSIYYDVLKYKRNNSMDEMIIDRGSLKKIIRTGRELYEVKAPKGLFTMSNKSDIARVQSVALEIIKRVLDSLYNTMQSEEVTGSLETNEDTIIEYIPDEFEISIYEEHDEDLDIEDIQGKDRDELKKSDNDLVPILHYIGEGYYPIFDSSEVIKDNTYDEENEEELKEKINNVIHRVHKEGIEVQSEKDFIDEFEDLYNDNFSDLPVSREDVLLMRNQSRSGVGFSTAGNYYPDFILWIFYDDKQYISFIDPKGLSEKVDENSNKRKIRLCEQIRDLFDDENADVSSYIYTNTNTKYINYSLFEDFNGDTKDDKRKNANTYISEVERKNGKMHIIHKGEGVKGIIEDILDQKDK